MEENTRGIRCAHYFHNRNKSLSGETLDEQGRMCYSICRGVDNPDSPNCHLYTPVLELIDFRRHHITKI